MLANIEDSIFIRVSEKSRKSQRREKAYLQAEPTIRLIIYEPPLEPEDDEKYVWKAILQLYRKIEAARFWLHSSVL